MWPQQWGFLPPVEVGLSLASVVHKQEATGRTVQVICSYQPCSAPRRVHGAVHKPDQRAGAGR